MPLKNENVAPPRAGRREWIGLAVIALACILYVMDLRRGPEFRHR
jgi:DHA2 family multidrug resistance protein-like MFS transporter